MSVHHKIVLIGGSSHVGKSTLAQSLASHLGWSYRSTDKLARHPGRPWQPHPKAVPDHVADHYLSLSADELIMDVLRHYRDRVWPLIEEIVTFHTTDAQAGSLVMEGSAILPDLVPTLDSENLVAIWLTGNQAFFEQRIYTASQYETKLDHERTMIDKFLGRTVTFNKHMEDTANQLGLITLDVADTPSVEELAAQCLSIISKQFPQ